MRRYQTMLALCGLALTLGMPRVDAAEAMPPSSMPGTVSLAGAWTLVRVDNIYPDGRRVELYGPHPQGLWLIDAQGRYMMQIVRARRAPFAANDKSRGSPAEYRAASLDSNAHYGRVSADGTTLYTHIDQASFPNWNGSERKAPYTLKGDELTYAVGKPTSGTGDGARGEVTWRRLR